MNTLEYVEIVNIKNFGEKRRFFSCVVLFVVVTVAEKMYTNGPSPTLSA